jgi:myo-inositol-1(or 4)-monophosphatase
MNLQLIEKEVIEICQQVGEFIRTEGLSFDLSKVEQKQSFNNLVSYVDKEAEKKLIHTLEKIIPGSSCLGEEGTSLNATAAEYHWIIDPLDGTTNFLHGLPVFGVSVALQRNEETILGVVYEINRHECFHAIKDAQACLNNKAIKVSPAKHLNESLLATGFPYEHFDKKDLYLEIIKDFLGTSHGIRRLGSAAIDLAYVACGRLEGFFEYNLNAWDVAAGAFIVQQAGGIVTDFKGGSDFLHGNELVAACSVHPQMLSVIQHYWNT